MRQTTIGVGYPARPLLLLIYTTIGVSVFAGLTETFLRGSWYGLHELLGLSWWGFSRGMLWQPFSYLLLHHGQWGLSLGFFIGVLFHMYLLYMMGTAVYDHVGNRRFFLLYFGSGVVAGLATLMMMGGGLLVGSTPAVFGVLTLWAMLYPETELMLMFAGQVKGRWLWVIILGISILIDLSHAQFAGITTTITGALAGYFYGLVAFNLRGPFPQTHRFDAVIAGVGQQFQKRRAHTQSMMQDAYKKAKVFDFKTGEAILDDEEFMDAMLAKISKYGEKSLSRKERKRMKVISDTKTTR